MVAKKTFVMATRTGAETVPYVSEFEWGGETFVIARPHGFFGLSESGWRVSHKDTGFAFGETAETPRACKKAAIAFLEEKGEEALQKAIRKARRKIKKEHMK